jgi:hypothetical protein
MEQGMALADARARPMGRPNGGQPTGLLEQLADGCTAIRRWSPWTRRMD